MLHFSCDLCGKELLSEVDRRFVVKMDVYSAGDPHGLTDADLDDDQLESLGEVLAELEATGTTADLPPDFKQLRFDLCPNCHQKFLRDPLNKDALKFDFSEN